MKKILMVGLLCFVLLLGFVGYRFGSALTQEGNPIPYLISITKYELSNNGYEQVLETENGIRYVSQYEKKYPLGMAIEYMKSKGWEFKEQMGSGLVFVKNEEEITISTKQYSKHYFLWDVPNEVIH
ncbi:hypothetical protein LCL95_00730 [Bacillus timonensis]|nr:hypothetical protein [Bacillus timonensis]